MKEEIEASLNKSIAKQVSLEPSMGVASPWLRDLKKMITTEVKTQLEEDETVPVPVALNVSASPSQRGRPSSRSARL